MSISDVSSFLGTIVGCIYPPVATRLSCLRLLKSNAERLFKNTEELEALKADLSRRMEDMETRDPSKEGSQTAKGWIASVQDLVGSSAAFRARFDSRRSSWNCLRCGFYSNHELATEAEGFLEEAADLMTRGETFTTDPERLVSPLSEFLLILKTLDSKARSLEKAIKDLGNRKIRLESW